MDFFIPVISVVGFGETGSIIASLVNNSKQNIKINIIDPDLKLEGKVLDFKHASIPNNNEIYWNNDKLLSKSQLIFYTAGVRGKAGESRNQKATENRKIIKDVFEEIPLKRTALIVTISNPVEAIAQWIHEIIKGKCSVISTGTLLDTYRLKTILGDFFNLSTSFIDTLVIGEHGSEMFPLWSQTKIKEQFITELVNQDQLNAFTEELKNTATKIRETQAATKYGVAQTALVLADQYFARQSKLMPITFQGNEFINEEIYINWPSFVGKQHIIPANLKLDQEEQYLWENALASIRKTSKI